jgi:hypothetical protein
MGIFSGALKTEQDLYLPSQTCHPSMIPTINTSRLPIHTHSGFIQHIVKSHLTVARQQIRIMATHLVTTLREPGNFTQLLRYYKIVRLPK